MDFIKQAMNKGSNDQKDHSQAQGSEQKDYVDKGRYPLPTSLCGLQKLTDVLSAFAFAAGKAGYGDKISADQQEKITDAGRSAYEKATGYVHKALCFQPLLRPVD